MSNLRSFSIGRAIDIAVWILVSIVAGNGFARADAAPREEQGDEKPRVSEPRRSKPAPTDDYLRGYIESWLELARGLAQGLVEVDVVDGAVVLRFDPDAVSLSTTETAAIAGFEGVVRVSIERSQAAGREETVARVRSWRSWLRPPPGRKTVRFPEGDLFSAPMADTKQPRFHATYQNYETEFGSINIGSVGFGETFGLIRAPRQKDGNGWQLGFSGAVMALFNLDGPSTDLINADYFLGVPLSWRNDAWSGRARLYHLSSHVGDEFLLDDPVPGFRRINLSYEALELLFSYDDPSGARFYGGVNRIFNSATSLKRLRGQFGLEFQGKPREWRDARFVAAVDLQAWEETDWDLDISVNSGLSFRSPYAGQRSLRFVLEYFNGHVPHGQFYVYRTEYFGLGIAFGL